MGIAATPAIASISDLANTTETITIDGVLDETAWQHATKIQIDNETRPGENIPARVATVAYLIENGEALYVAFDARRAFVFFSNPLGVQMDVTNDDVNKREDSSLARLPAHRIAGGSSPGRPQDRRLPWPQMGADPTDRSTQ